MIFRPKYGSTANTTALIRKQVSGDGIGLTKSRWTFGSIWHEQASSFSSWELELEFEILPSLSTPKRHADGFALLYVRDMLPDSTFGTVNQFVGLGIIIDTYRNRYVSSTEPPWLQAHVLNGTQPYSWREDGIPTALVNLDAPVLGKPKSKLTVRYQDEKLMVTLDFLKGSKINELAIHFVFHFIVGILAVTRCAFFVLP